MVKLTSDAEQGLRIVDDLLGSYSLDADNLRGAIEALREVVDTEKIFLYSVGQRGDGDDVTVTRDLLVGNASVPAWGEVLDAYMVGRGVQWAGYSAVRPESAQRDVVLTASEIDVLTQGKSCAIRAELSPRLGVADDDCMRVLVCDGSNMLASLSCLQPTPIAERQRMLLDRVVPGLRRRLEFDRMVAQASLADSAIVVALDAIPGAAWLVGPNREIRYANAAGRARLDSDRTCTYDALIAATIAPTASSQFKVATVRTATSATHIVVENADPSAGANDIVAAVKRLGLTPAQGRVFEQVVGGSSNATIAAELGVAERTVEAHVTAVLVKAQVSSRAALIVQLFKGQRARVAQR